MEVIVKKRGRPVGKKMSVSEREAVEDRLQSMSSQVITVDPRSSNQPDMPFAGAVQDKGVLSAQVNRMKETLEKDEDMAAKGKEKDRVQAEVDKAAEFLKENVPPLWLQKARPGTPEYAKAIAAGDATNKDPRINKAFEIYQNGRRRLDPNNPMAGSISEIITK